MVQRGPSRGDRVARNKSRGEGSAERWDLAGGAAGRVRRRLRRGGCRALASRLHPPNAQNLAITKVEAGTIITTGISASHSGQPSSVRADEDQAEVDPQADQRDRREPGELRAVQRRAAEGESGCCRSRRRPPRRRSRPGRPASGPAPAAAARPAPRHVASPSRSTPTTANRLISRTTAGSFMPARSGAARSARSRPRSAGRMREPVALRGEQARQQAVDRRRRHGVVVGRGRAGRHLHRPDRGDRRKQQRVEVARLDDLEARAASNRRAVVRPCGSGACGGAARRAGSTSRAGRARWWRR